LKEEIIIITNNSNKKMILREISKNKLLLNIKFLTFNDLKKKLYFDYDYKTIEYIINKYNVKASIALMYLENMYFLKDINNKKICFLYELKKDLEDKKDVIMKDNLLFDEIQKLEDMYKSVFILHYLEDFKTNDIGAILEVSEETVKTRLKRARESLKDGLKIEE